MRLYLTLVQPLYTTDRDLGKYLGEQGIKFYLGADRMTDLAKLGYKADSSSKIIMELSEQSLLATYIVLMDDADLSAIKLSIPEVQIIRNRPSVNFVNNLRRCFSWFLK